MSQNTPLPRIDNRSARDIFLARHGLADNPRAKQSRDDLLALIKRNGFVQVDTINTVARAHDMILFARNQTYRPVHLKRLLEQDRALFENWTHDAAIIPTEFYPYWCPRFARSAERIKERWTNWRRSGFIEKLDDILAHIERDGPAMARHLGTGEKKSNGGWWDWHPSKTALEYLWRTGELAVTRREGFQKVYDLTDRVVPAPIGSSRPTRRPSSTGLARPRSTGSASPRRATSPPSGARSRPRRRPRGANASMTTISSRLRSPARTAQNHVEPSPDPICPTWRAMPHPLRRGFVS